eukprot:gene2602-5092_t
MLLVVVVGPITTAVVETDSTMPEQQGIVCRVADVSLMVRLWIKLGKGVNEGCGVVLGGVVAEWLISDGTAFGAVRRCIVGEGGEVVQGGMIWQSVKLHLRTLRILRFALFKKSQQPNPVQHTSINFSGQIHPETPRPLKGIPFPHHNSSQYEEAISTNPIPTQNHLTADMQCVYRIDRTNVYELIDLQQFTLCFPYEGLYFPMVFPQSGYI